MAKLKFGKAFTDEINKVSIKTKHFSKSKHQEGSSWEDYLVSNSSVQLSDSENMSDWRKVSLLVILFLVLTIYIARLFHLQVVSGAQSRELADSNRIQVKIIHAPRGVIYDRNGTILAQNEPGFRYVEGTKVSYPSRDQALKLEVENSEKLKNLEVDSNRTYLFKEKTAHILGYVSEITEDELKDTKFKNYKLGDKIGRGGVEETYEKILKGIDGGEIIEVDASGKKVRTLRKTDPVPGQNLYLTVDKDIQLASYDKLLEGIQKAESCCGSIISQDPQTGEILSLVSIPSFDPTDIQKGLTSENSPFLNRAISGTYPPGSTFKMVPALAGLETGKITPQTQYEDTGVMNLGPFTFSNWYFTQHGRKDGQVDLVKALQRSNDIYFYQLGNLIGEKAIGDMAKSLGFGKLLGIDIPGEAVGLVPDDAWKQEKVGEVWYPGDTLHMSIGQGFVLTTPIQILNLTSTIAANGKQYPPHLVLKITDPLSNRNIKEYKYDELSKLNLKSEDLGVIKKGLEAVPKDGGTAWPFFTFPIQTAGKTGTAEFGDSNKTHAWYTGYGPVENPRISITAMVEAGGEGSSTTGQIVKEVMRNFFSEDKSNLIKDINVIATDPDLIGTDSARTLGE